MSASSEYLDALVALSGQKAQAQATAARQRGQIIGNTLQSLGQIVPQIQQARQQQQDRTALNQDRVAQAKLRDLQTQEAAGNLQQQQANQQGDLAAAQATSDLLQPQPDGSVTFDPVVAMQRMSAAGVPIAIAQKHLQALKEMNDLGRTFQATKVDRAAELADSFLRTHQDGEPVDPQALGLFADFAQKNGMTDQGSADALKQAAQRGGDPRKMLEGIRNLSPKFAKDKTPIKLGPNEALVDPTDFHQLAAGNPPAITPEQAATNTRADAAAAETARHNKAMEARPVGRAPASDETSNVKDAVQGMIDGIVPPILPGRASKDYIALIAEAKRRGYDLAGAATDWAATQKHISTLNGQQQTNLNQAINALPDLLDSVDTLADQWKGGRYPLLNKASLTLAKNGAFGDKAATIANQLDAQIADVTSDLGKVYMGGNTPTDHSLDLAAKALSGNWSQQVLKDMTAMARKNVQIRQNSIKNTGVQGASADNPYGSAPPPVEKTVTGAQLQAIAKKNGTTVEQEQQRATAAGYLVR